MYFVSIFVVLLKNYLVILNPLHFCTNFRISLPISQKTKKKLCGILTETELNLYINLKRHDILIIMSVLNQNHDLFLHLPKLFEIFSRMFSCFPYADLIFVLLKLSLQVS